MSLLEDTIDVIDELLTKRASSSTKPSQITGIGVSKIYSELLLRQIQARTLQDPKIKYSDIFDMLCTSMESISIFKFEGADALDVYFSLKGPKEEMLEIARRAIKPPPFDKTNFKIDRTPVEMPHFERLTRDVQELLKEELSISGRNAELRKENEELEIEIAAMGNPIDVKNQLALLQDALSKLE